MKLKSEPADSVVCSDLNEIMEVRFSPEVDTEKSFPKQNLTLGYLLSALKSFYVKIDQARKLIGIKEVDPLAKNATMGNIFDIEYQYDDNQRTILRECSFKIVENYRLHQSWVFPIKIAILTHTLLIPPEENSIHIHLPAEPTSSFTNNDDNFLKFPGIYFTSKITMNKLRDWVNKRQKLISEITGKLPKIKSKYPALKTIHWGHLAWISKLKGVNSWVKITKGLGINMDRYGSLEIGFKDPPESNEIKKYYSRFVSALNKLESQT